MEMAIPDSVIMIFGYPGRSRLNMFCRLVIITDYIYQYIRPVPAKHVFPIVITHYIISKKSTRRTACHSRPQFCQARTNFCEIKQN
eukprot:SAG31_NODE_2586_length_5430_cov_2.815044_1_plen_86_part_00